jgi:hypothetical protein
MINKKDPFETNIIPKNSLIEVKEKKSKTILRTTIILLMITILLVGIVLAVIYAK